MKLLISLLLFCSTIFAHFPRDYLRGIPRDYLSGKISPYNQRYNTFRYALQLLEERHAQTLVETGTARGGSQNFEGDGGSTIIFTQWAKDHHAHLFSIDISADNLNNAREAVCRYVPRSEGSVHYIHNDSISYLQQIDFEIDFLYLDSYDYEFNNPNPSQIHHLKEIQAAYPHLTEKSIVMIDDCNLPEGGKGKYVIEFLLERGWKVVQYEYQAILVKQ